MSNTLDTRGNDFQSVKRSVQKWIAYDKSTENHPTVKTGLRFLSTDRWRGWRPDLLWQIKSLIWLTTLCLNRKSASYFRVASCSLVVQRNCFHILSRFLKNKKQYTKYFCAQSITAYHKRFLSPIVVSYDLIVSLYILSLNFEFLLIFSASCEEKKFSLKNIDLS